MPEPTAPTANDNSTQQPAVPNPAHHPIELPPEDQAILDAPPHAAPATPELAGLIVVRAAPGSTTDIEGLWFDRSEVPIVNGRIDFGDGDFAHPTGRYETRHSDGAQAEVWEITNA